MVACKRKDEEKILHKHNLIILPQLYQTELLFRSHDQMGNQGIDKVQQRILHRFDWPGLSKACDGWVNAYLACLQVKDPRKMKFPLKSVENSKFNEVVQIDHQKICMTESGYNQTLVIIDHFTKLAEAVPCQTASAEETCDHLITHWISRYGCPMTFQSDNGKAFVGDLTKESMKGSHIAQAHSTTYHPQTNGLVERQNRTLVNMLRVYCSRYMTDWDKYLPQYATINNGHQSFHVVDGQGESNAPDILSPGIRREEDVASSLRERSNQETAGTARALQEEHGASTNETAQEM